MNELIKIVDFGCSEYSYGFSGDIEPFHTYIPKGVKNNDEFWNFLKSNIKDDN